MMHDCTNRTTVISQMTSKQLKTFHERPPTLIPEVETKQTQQKSLVEQVLRLQNQPNEQQKAIDTKLPVEGGRQSPMTIALHHVSHAFEDTHRNLSELQSKMAADVKRQSGQCTNHVSAATRDEVASATAAAYTAMALEAKQAAARKEDDEEGADTNPCLAYRRSRADVLWGHAENQKVTRTWRPLDDYGWS